MRTSYGELGSWLLMLELQTLKVSHLRGGTVALPSWPKKKCRGLVCGFVRERHSHHASRTCTSFLHATQESIYNSPLGWAHLAVSIYTRRWREHAWSSNTNCRRHESCDTGDAGLIIHCSSACAYRAFCKREKKYFVLGMYLMLDMEIEISFPRRRNVVFTNPLCNPLAFSPESAPRSPRRFEPAPSLIRVIRPQHHRVAVAFYCMNYRSWLKPPSPCLATKKKTPRTPTPEADRPKNMALVSRRARTKLSMFIRRAARSSRTLTAHAPRTDRPEAGG